MGHPAPGWGWFRSRLSAQQRGSGPCRVWGGEGKSRSVYVPCLRHTHRVGTFTTKGLPWLQNPLRAVWPPTTGDGAAAALLPPAHDVGPTLADSSCPLTHLYSHLPEWETEAQAASHGARDQGGEVQVTPPLQGQDLHDTKKTLLSPVSEGSPFSSGWDL